MEVPSASWAAPGCEVAGEGFTGVVLRRLGRRVRLALQPDGQEVWRELKELRPAAAAEAAASTDPSPRSAAAVLTLEAAAAERSLAAEACRADRAALGAARAAEMELEKVQRELVRLRQLLCSCAHAHCSQDFS